jgi:anti-anti-sigma factor
MDLTEDPAPIGGIDVATVQGRTVVRLWGEVDGALRAEASSSMAQALASTAPIVVDTTDVTFIDSSGLAFILQLHLAATETGQPLTLLDPHREVLEKLDMLGMAGELELEPERAIA